MSRKFFSAELSNYLTINALIENIKETIKYRDPFFNFDNILNEVTVTAQAQYEDSAYIYIEWAREMTAEEQAEHDKVEAQRQKFLDEMQRKQYEQLKAKFG